MSEQNTKPITEDGLLIELHRLGHRHVTKRRISNWRHNDLLPRFDIAGAGQGRGGGRAQAMWQDSRRVIEQAVLVSDLLEKYDDTFSGLYIPLLMRGFDVPVGRIRQLFRDTLDKMTEEIDGQNDSRSKIEDFIFDRASEMSDKVKKLDPKLRVPTPTQEAILNLIFTPDYKLSDEPFEHGTDAFQTWESQHGLATEQPEGIGLLLAYAPFFQEHLSIHQVEQAAHSCSDDDYRQMARDLRKLYEIFLVISKVAVDWSRGFSPELQPKPQDILFVLFEFASLFAAANLSLRHGGFGPIIDQCLDAILNDVRKGLPTPDDSTAQEFAHEVTDFFADLSLTFR
jgi:hypothetical protein